jgi:hypothetical protein
VNDFAAVAIGSRQLAENLEKTTSARNHSPLIHKLLTTPTLAKIAPVQGV